MAVSRETVKAKVQRSSVSRETSQAILASLAQHDETTALAL
jgi:hypothetical protein